MNVRKRGLALLMCICMIFTLLPFSAFADGTSEPDVVYGKYDNGPWTQVNGMTADSSAQNYENKDTGADVTYSKTATPVEGQNDTYNITLKIESKMSSIAPGASAVVLVIDSSGSMKDGRLENAKNVAKSFIDSYGKSGSDRYLAVVNFDTYANAFEFGRKNNKTSWLDVSNGTNRQSAKNGFDNLYAGGGTNLEQGLTKAKDLLNASTVKSIANENKFVIVLTDGAPTYYSAEKNGNFITGYYPNGEGNSCNQDTYDATVTAATKLKSSANSVYTVCYGAQNEIIDCTNETVSYFLKTKIATSAALAYEASDGDESLKTAFEEIYKSIEKGLDSGFTVTDPMGKYVTLDESSITGNGASVKNGTITWTPTTGEVSEKNGVKTYTYTLTYTVKLDTSADGFVDNKYYATNDVTTLAFKDGDENITRNFNVPGVKGESPKCTVTYNKGAHGSLADQNTDGNVVYSSVKLGSATPKAPDVTPDNGWYFTGWDKDIAPTVTEDVTYTAQYKIKDDLSYTVHYYWNGTNDKVAEDKVVESQTFNTIVTEKPATVPGYTPVSADSKTITIGTDTNANVITFYYYKNVELKANGDTVTYDGKVHSVSGFTGAPEGADFSAITVGAKGTEAGTYPANFAEGTVGTVDTTGKYIVTETTNGELIINPAYQITYQYSNAPENAPTCPVDNAYYADGTTVSPLENPGTLEGYIFSGWKINGEGDAVNSVTFAGANIKLIGEWKPVTGLTCTINYIWNGNKTTPIRTDTIDGLTYNEVVTKFPMEIPGYTPISNNSQEIIVKTTGNVINFYYYKNVTLESNSGKFTYNGKDHSVSGYDVITKADNGKDVKVDAEFIGVSASRTEKDVGSYPVTFKFKGNLVDKEGLIGKIDSNLYYIVSDVKEGTLTIEKIKDEVTVKITGNTKTVTYNGKEHNVTGYATDVGDKPITVALKDGKVAEAKGTDVGTYYMQLTAAGFVVTSDIYANIKVIVEDGWLKINRRPMPPVNPPITDKITVEITGNSDSVVYDGTEHSVKDYTVKISDSRYTEKDFTFSGKALASGVNAGAYEMGLKADQFKNTNARFTNVEFIIKADGVLTITQRPLTITAGSAEGIAPVTCDKYTVEGLATGDKVDSVKITGIQSEPGESPNVASDAVIKNAKGEDVTANYKITYVDGVLKAIEVLNKEIHFNYVIGYTDGTIRPNNDISRAEVATIFFRLLTDEAREQYTTTAGNFTDVKAGMWCNRAIATLTNMGIIKGYTDGSFQPNKSITRAELATIIARFAKLDVNTKTFSDINGHWAQKNIELAAGNGWINGYEDGTFRPNNNITRAETFAMINRVLDRQTESVSDLLPTSEMNMWSDNLNENAWYYKDVQEATNYHKCDRVGDSVYEKWTEKVPDIDWASYQI